jgi:hypothetical protein
LSLLVAAVAWDGQTIEARTIAAAIAQHVRTEIIQARTSFFSILHELDWVTLFDSLLSNFSPMPYEIVITKKDYGPQEQVREHH